MACDLRVAADRVRFCISETPPGVPHAWGLVACLLTLDGSSNVKELILPCDELSAQEVLRLGLVNQDVPGKELIEAT